MENLRELVEKVREEGLSKDRLEAYHTDITYLDNLYRMEIAPIEKEEALFFQGNKSWKDLATGENVERADVTIKRLWKATPQGQRQIELSHMLKITPKLLQSIKTRLYSIY